MRGVTEQDFRKEEFRSAKTEDYEFNDSGDLVRKDRWVSGLNRVARMIGAVENGKFEIPDVIERVEALVAGASDKYKMEVIFYSVEAEIDRFNNNLFSDTRFCAFLDVMDFTHEDWLKYKKDYKTDYIPEELFDIFEKAFAGDL